MVSHVRGHDAPRRATSEKRNDTMKLIGMQAIKYVQHLGGSVMPQTDLPEYNGSFTSIEAAIAKAVTSPRDVYFIADPSHADHAAIMSKLSS